MGVKWEGNYLPIFEMYLLNQKYHHNYFSTLLKLLPSTNCLHKFALTIMGTNAIKTTQIFKDMNKGKPNLKSQS